MQHLNWLQVNSSCRRHSINLNFSRKPLVPQGDCLSSSKSNTSSMPIRSNSSTTNLRRNFETLSNENSSFSSLNNADLPSSNEMSVEDVLPSFMSTFKTINSNRSFSKSNQLKKRSTKQICATFNSVSICNTNDDDERTSPPIPPPFPFHVHPTDKIQHRTEIEKINSNFQSEIQQAKIRLRKVTFVESFDHRKLQIDLSSSKTFLFSFLFVLKTILIQHLHLRT